jgi:hypothetical protein
LKQVLLRDRRVVAPHCLRRHAEQGNVAAREQPVCGAVRRDSRVALLLSSPHARQCHRRQHASRRRATHLDGRGVAQTHPRRSKARVRQCRFSATTRTERGSSNVGVGVGGVGGVGVCAGWTGVDGEDGVCVCVCVCVCASYAAHRCSRARHVRLTHPKNFRACEY